MFVACGIWCLAKAPGGCMPTPHIPLPMCLTFIMLFVKVCCCGFIFFFVICHKNFNADYYLTAKQGADTLAFTALVQDKLYPAIVSVTYQHVLQKLCCGKVGPVKPIYKTPDHSPSLIPLKHWGVELLQVHVSASFCKLSMNISCLLCLAMLMLH